MAKLVEVLAQELKVWPEGVVFFGADNDGEIRAYAKGEELAEFDFYPSEKIDLDDRSEWYGCELCPVRVTRAMWQSERDRQKGGEWKRHRGGKQPKSVSDGEMVEVRLRCGETQVSQAEDFIWNHGECDRAANIMAFRVLEKPEQEEKEVEAAEPVSIDQFVADNVAAFNSDWHFGQIDGPLKWRDGIAELEAYIEEFNRERDELIDRLASEGFALIPPVAGVVSEFTGVDMQDWRNWKVGDIVMRIYNSVCSAMPMDEEYPVDSIDWSDEDQPIKIGDWYWPYVCDLKFIRRP